MKKVLLTLLGVIVALGLLAGAGFAGFRIGLQQGVAASGNAPSVRVQPFNRDEMPRFGPGMNNRGFNRMPYANHFFLMGRGGWLGLGVFSVLGFVWRLALLGLILWFIYWLFTKSGWRITRQVHTETAKSTPVESTEEKSE